MSECRCHLRSRGSCDYCNDRNERRERANQEFAVLQRIEGKLDTLINLIGAKP